MPPSKKRTEKKKALILDVSSLVYRAYHALPELTAATGEPAGALYGFIAILFKVIRERKPTYLFAAMDLPGKTFRHDTFRAYKATRPPTPDDLIVQLKRSREALEAFGTPILAAEGFEADDAIATATGRLREADPDMLIEIVSGDADILQLVDERTAALTPKRGATDFAVMDPAAVSEKLGVPPKLVTAFKALRGDPSDNIPGLSGVGEKTAAALLQYAGSLQALFQQAAHVPDDAPKELKRFAQALTEQRNEIIQTQALVTLRDDMPIRVDMEKGALPEAPPAAFLSMLKRLGFESLLARAGGGKDKGKSARKPAEDFHTFIRDQEQQVERDIQAGEASGMFSPEIAELERKLIPVISAMEQSGFLVDQAALQDLRIRFGAEQESVQKEIFSLAGHDFNLSSPKQLGAVLYEELHITSRKKTAGGQQSTAAAVLETLRDAHPIVARLLRWREITKLLTTYVESFPKLIDARDSRIHAKFWQLGTATGRIASSEPNLQNIPMRSEDGKAVRNIFVSPKNSLLLAADYSQIELRVAAVLSQDPAMIEVFRQGADVHDETARKIFHADSATPQMRRRAKVLNFGILYGMGPRRVAQELRVSFEEAEAFLDEYFSAFSRLAQWIERTKRDAQSDGFTETAFGRKRFFPEFRSGNPALRNQAERAAVNAPIQGTAADLVKRGMVALGKIPEARMVAQVHDEIVFEVPETHIDEAATKIRAALESVWPEAPISFPIRLLSGARWGELKATAV